MAFTQYPTHSFGVLFHNFVFFFSHENNWIVGHCLTPEIFVPLLQKVNLLGHVFLSNDVIAWQSVSCNCF